MIMTIISIIIVRIFVMIVIIGLEVNKEYIWACESEIVYR